jgi:hypothetical protein
MLVQFKGSTIPERLRSYFSVRCIGEGIKRCTVRWRKNLPIIVQVMGILKEKWGRRERVRGKAETLKTGSGNETATSQRLIASRGGPAPFKTFPSARSGPELSNARRSIPRSTPGSIHVVGCQDLSQPNKSTHDLNVDVDRPTVFKHRGKHGNPVLGKRELFHSPAFS